jgi:dTDP-4-dehydrorhamnose reductase
MPRVLITGGSGQIGSALIASAPAGCEIFAPDSKTLDISRSGSVDRAFDDCRPELVINAAAYTAVDKAEAERERAFAINADGAGHIARACRKDQIPLIHLSTDYVFDGSKTTAYTEQDAPNPLSVYGASKLAGERQIEDARTPYLILRVAWVFSAVGTNFVRTMLRLAGNDVLRVVDDQLGTPCAARDIARVVWRAADRFEASREHPLLHFSSKPPTTWFGFAKAIFEDAVTLGIVERAPRLEPIPAAAYPTAARRPANSLLDSTHLQRLVALEPADWRDSLREVLRQLRDGY